MLGTYSIDENGDTSLTDYGVYRSRTAKLMFDQIDQGAAQLDAADESLRRRAGSVRARRVVLRQATRTMEAAPHPPPQPPAPSERRRQFIGERIGLIAVLLALPVYFAIHDLATTTSRASATTSSTASPTAPSGRWWRSATRSSTASSS